MIEKKKQAQQVQNERNINLATYEPSPLNATFSNFSTPGMLIKSSKE